MPKCSFCECEIPLPSGKIREAECPRCGRPIELDVNDLLSGSDASATLSLVQLSTGKSVELPLGQTLTLGREAYGSELFQDLKFSRKHCLLETNPEAISICDLGSTNGTFVNGIRILSKTFLQGDEQLTLADELFTLKLNTAPAPEMSTAAPEFLHVCDNCDYEGNEDLPRCPKCGFGWN